MKTNNICKFASTGGADELSILSFVLESDYETMKKESKLSANRMILITEGDGKLSIGGETVSFSKGSLVFGLEGEVLHLVTGERVQYAYIDFKGTRSSTLLHRFGIFPNSRARGNFESLIPLCLDSIVRTPSENVDIAAEGILLYIFSRFHTEESETDSTVGRIIEITDEHFRDFDLSISDIAEELGYNPKYLSHLFKKKMKLSYSEYLRSVRFKYAISLFELGISSVKNVALLSGFRDPLYFSSAFKKFLGISPKDFVENFKKQN
jgi:AraC-like DNA-binding protein